jgi:hypothetical protein
MALSEALGRVLTIAHPNSADTHRFRHPEIHFGRKGFLITCVQGPLPAGLNAISLGPKGDRIESIVWDPAVLRIMADERFKKESEDRKGEKACRYAAERANWLNELTPGKYTFLIRAYPEEVVLVKIMHEPTLDTLGQIMI